MKTAMVWGANGGIGRALVATLRDKGWQVVAIARTCDGLHQLTPLVFEADVSRRRDVEETMLAVSYEVGSVDLWTYSVGDIISSRLEDMSPETWQRILDANLTGAFLTAHYSLPLLAPDAHLFLLGAVSQRMQLPGLAAYAAAKAGLEALGETLRKEARQRKVTVVRPGAVKTPLWDKVPFTVPANALPADAVAEAILRAYEQGHKGTLDLA